MLGRSTGAVLVGVDATLIRVEVDLCGGLPTISAVGLPDPAVREGIDRIRSAIRHSGFDMPTRRIVVNLAPAEVRKQGASLDLPIAVALLRASGELTPSDPNTLLAGELGLDGSVRPIRGTLAAVLAAREAGSRRVLVPRENAGEAALVGGVESVAVADLREAVAVLRGRRGRDVSRIDPEERLRRAGQGSGPDLHDVRGQHVARRALEVSAAGGHHLLLSGPPGAGKSMLAGRLPGILPPLSVDEALLVTRIHSASGLARGLVSRRPFRAPHHGVSQAGLTGGGSGLRPGEMSLATHGVLFLDEVTEFRRDALEALRQPLEEGSITVVRVRGVATFPAVFTLLASMNPCPCGYRGDPGGRCDCTDRDVARYRSKLSGPLLDRFDLRIDVPPVALDCLARPPDGEASATVRARVVEARARQRERLGADGPACNGRMRPAELERWAALGRGPERLLLAACRKFGLSARAYDRVRRVARTLADMEGAGPIEERHVAEALQYRQPESALT